MKVRRFRVEARVSRLALEALASIRGAGADLVITCFAEETASWLGGKM